MMHVQQLDSRVSLFKGTVVDCTELFMFFSFDVMGIVAFGKSFDMVESNKMHTSIGILKDGMSVVGPLTPVPWLFRTVAVIPGLSRDWRRLIAWTEEQVLERIKIDRKEPDVSRLFY